MPYATALTGWWHQGQYDKFAIQIKNASKAKAKQYPSTNTVWQSCREQAPSRL